SVPGEPEHLVARALHLALQLADGPPGSRVVLQRALGFVPGQDERVLEAVTLAMGVAAGRAGEADAAGAEAARAGPGGVGPARGEHRQQRDRREHELTRNAVRHEGPPDRGRRRVRATSG